MRLLEYEAKGLLRAAGLLVPAGHIVKYWAMRRALGWPLMVKAQIPAGGRGKAGGVVKASNLDELEAAADRMLGSRLLGHKVASVLIEEAAEAAGEVYVAIVLDRAQQALVLLAHKAGGIDVNEYSKTHDPWRYVLHGPPDGPVARQLADFLDLNPHVAGQLEAVLAALWHTAVDNDALLVEINPLIVTPWGALLCADAKIELDDAAAFRHRDWQFETDVSQAQFVVLSPTGTVASMANGAGLAMATVDAITAAGATAANFFDVGGGSSTEEMTAGLAKIRALGRVQAVVVNIFAGISRCDEVAKAIIAAREADPNPLPMFVRLEGTNAVAGRQLLEAEGVLTLPSLAECVKQAVTQVQNA